MKRFIFNLYPVQKMGLALSVVILLTGLTAVRQLLTQQAQIKEQQALLTKYEQIFMDRGCPDETTN